MNSALQTTRTDTTNEFKTQEKTHGLRIIGVEPQPIIERRSTSIAEATSKAPLASPKKTQKRSCRMAMKRVVKVNKCNPAFCVLYTENQSLNVLVAAKNVESGLNKGETVVLVCEERPDVIERKLSMLNTDIKNALAEGRLVIVSMDQRKQDPYEMPVNTSYKYMFKDLKGFVQKPIGRIVVLELNKYLDLESEYRAMQSMQTFYEAAGAVDCPVLTHAIHDESVASELLVKVCREVTSRFFSLVKENNQLRLSSKTNMH